MTGDRSWVYWDRFMPLQMAREHRLKPVETLVLITLANNAFFREKTWTGNITDLAMEMHASWTSVDDAVKHLIAEGLLILEEPFGRNRSGRVKVAVYDLLIPDRERRNAGLGESYSRESAGIANVETAPDSRAIPAQFPRHSRVITDITSEDTVPVGIAVKEEGVTRSTRAKGDICSSCGEEAEFEDEDGKPFCAHCTPNGLIGQGPTLGDELNPEREHEHVDGLGDDTDHEEPTDLSIERLDELTEHATIDDAPPHSDDELAAEDGDQCDGCGRPVTLAPTVAEDGWASLCATCYDAQAAK